MVTSVAPAPQRSSGRSVSVARALGSTTRAGIFEHLRSVATPLTVRDVAATFDLHPNVARTHLETLADAGLVAVGRRKHPRGGRPAKVYVARDDADVAAAGADGGRAVSGPAAAALVRLLLGLAAGRGDDLLARAHESGRAEGRRLVTALTGASVRRPVEDDATTALEAAAQTAVRALRTIAGEARVLKAGRDWVDIGGVHGAFPALTEERPDVAEAVERGLLQGGFAAAGTPVTLSEAGAAPGGGQTWRARASAAGALRATPGPAATVDARGQQREAGVVSAMRAVTRLSAGDVLEVLTEGPGSPAAFARWADRAGHVLLGVERAVDPTGRPAIRLLIRKGA